MDFAKFRTKHTLEIKMEKIFNIFCLDKWDIAVSIIGRWMHEKFNVHGCEFLVLDDKAAWLDILCFETFQEMVLPPVVWKTSGQLGRNTNSSRFQEVLVYWNYSRYCVHCCMMVGWLTMQHQFYGWFLAAVFHWKTVGLFEQISRVQY